MCDIRADFQFGVVGAPHRLRYGTPYRLLAMELADEAVLLQEGVAHNEKIYPGQHAAIIESELWQAVQDRLAAGRRERSMAVGAEAPSLVSGLIFDSDGARLSPTHAVKKGKRHLLFSAQYQQQPVPVEGNLIRRSWFPAYRGSSRAGTSP
jgi:hypothetical protein